MDKKRIEKLAHNFGVKAEKAYRNYQDSGVPRYDREYRNNQELADIMTMALSAVDEHNAYISMRCDLAQLAGKCEHALRNPDEVASVLNSVVAVASAYGLYQRVRE